MKKNITYERVVLTFIAGLLFLNFIKDRDSQNQIETDRVRTKFASVNYAAGNFAIVPVNEDGSIDVNLSDISTHKKLNIHLKSADTWSLDDAGPIDVKIK